MGHRTLREAGAPGKSRLWQQTDFDARQLSLFDNAMSSDLIVTLELFGVLGIALLLGGWELWRLRRDKKQREDDSSLRQPSDQ